MVYIFYNVYNFLNLEIVLGGKEFEIFSLWNEVKIVEWKETNFIKHLRYAQNRIFKTGHFIEQNGT